MECSKSELEHKKHEALALRQRLELWKEDKKKKVHVQQKKPLFVSMVMKPVHEKTNVPLGKKPVADPVRPVMGKPGQGKAAQPNQTKKEAVQRKAAPANKPLSLKKNTTLTFTAVGKENTKASKFRTTKTLPGINKSEPSVSKTLVVKLDRLPIAVPKTPLSRRRSGHKRYNVANLVERAEGIDEPRSIADELQEAIGSCVDVAAQTVLKEAVTEAEEKSMDIDEDQDRPQGIVDNLKQAIEPTVDLPDEALLKEGVTEADGKKDCKVAGAAAAGRTTEASLPILAASKNPPSRDSLTAKFRKLNDLKHLSLSASAKKNVITLASKAVNGRPSCMSSTCVPGHSIAKPVQAAISKPPRSILKLKHKQYSRRFSFASPSVDASPFLQPTLSSVSKTFARVPLPIEGKTSTLTTPAGRVKFVTPSSTNFGDRTKYRKTPGTTKTHDFMRLKLNEWMEAKGRNPSGMRHVGCFGCNANACCPRLEQTPRSRVSSSMSLAQLTKQEWALTREERDPLCTSIFSSPEPRRTSTPLPSSRITRAAASFPLVASTDNTFIVNIDNCNEACRVGAQNTQEDQGMDEAAGTDNQTSVTWTEAEKKNSLSYSDIDQVERDFIKCVELVEQGTLSPEDALEWLQQVSEALVEVKHLSGWYKCKVAALRKTADQDALLAVFEQAIINNAQPAHEMAQLLTDTMKELLSQPSRKRKSSTRTPASSRRVRSEHAYAVHSGVDEENIFRSTAVRYSVMEVTPFKKRRRLTSTSACDSAVIPVITPVRRSTRVSTSHATPTCKSNARKSAPCAAMEFSALEDVPSAEKERMLFQPNQALEPLLGDSSPRFRDVSTIVCDSVPPVADGSPLLVPRFSAMKLGKEPVVE